MNCHCKWLNVVGYFGGNRPSDKVLHDAVISFSFARAALQVGGTMCVGHWSRGRVGKILQCLLGIL